MEGYWSQTYTCGKQFNLLEEYSPLVINDEYYVEVAFFVMEVKDDVEAVGDISFKRVSELIDSIGDYLEKEIEVVK